MRKATGKKKGHVADNETVDELYEDIKKRIEKNKARVRKYSQEKRASWHKAFFSSSESGNSVD